MNYKYSVRVKNDFPATYEQSQALIDSEFVVIVGVPQPSYNARITKNMPYFDAEAALEAIGREEEVVIEFF